MSDGPLRSVYGARVPSHTVDDAPEASRSVLGEMAAISANAYTMAILSMLASRVGRSAAEVDAIRAGRPTGHRRLDVMAEVADTELDAALRPAAVGA